MRSIGLAYALAISAGCASSDGGADGLSRGESAAALEVSLAAENISDPTTLPRSGLATYTGFMTLALPLDGPARDVTGDLDMRVDFGAARNQVSGSASNFAGLTGGLAIRGGDIDRGTDPDTDFTFDGSLTGTLAQNGDSYGIDGAIVGEFRGRNQDGLTGLVYGDITGPSGQDLFQGSMAASRDAD